MIEIIKDFMRFLWKQDSNSAILIIISLSMYMNRQDLKDAGQYCIEFAKLTKQ